MTHNPGDQPLYAPPPGWGRASGESAPYAVPNQWRSTPSGLPTGESTYPMFWGVPGITAGSKIRAAVVAVVGLIAATIATGAITSVGFTFIRGGGADWPFDGSGAIAINLVSLAARALAFAPLLFLSFLLATTVRQDGKWLHSVAGRVRWGWFLQCLAVSLVVVMAYIGIGAIAGSSFYTTSSTGVWWLPPVVLVLILIAAAGGEYLLRGVLNRGVASLVSSPAVGAVLGAVVSSAVYLLLSSAVFIYTRDVWGAVAVLLVGFLLCFVVWRTGGLEAAVAVSVASGVIAYAPLILPGLAELAQLPDGLPVVVMRLVPLVVAAAVITLMARVQGLQHTASPDGTSH